MVVARHSHRGSVLAHTAHADDITAPEFSRTSLRRREELDGRVTPSSALFWFRETTTITLLQSSSFSSNKPIASLHSTKQGSGSSAEEDSPGEARLRVCVALSHNHTRAKNSQHSESSHCESCISIVTRHHTIFFLFDKHTVESITPHHG